MRCSTSRSTLGHRSAAVACLLASLVIVFPVALPLGAQSPAPVSAPTRVLTDAEQTTFLAEGKLVRMRSAPKGVTGTLRVTLSDGTFSHDASVQTIDEYKAIFQTGRGTELNFYDTWRYNLAAYHINVMLGLDMVPVTIEREYRGKAGSYTWWVDDVLMDESERLKKKQQAPDQLRWNEQLWTLRIFDQLIENVDRNLTNLLIDTDWKVWMIDHSRAFRRHPELRNEKNLTRIDRELLAALKKLTADDLKERTGRWLKDDEIKPLLERRDLIVAFFEKLGPSGIYTRTSSTFVLPLTGANMYLGLGSNFQARPRGRG